MARNLFLLSEVRSGSSYAAELIAYNFAARHRIELWELLREPFQALMPTPSAAALRTILAGIWTAPGGVRAAMIKCSQILAIAEVLPDAPDLEHELFGPDTRWLVLRRGDHIAQAVSLHCAICSGSYHDYAPVPSCVPCRATDADLRRADDMIARSEEILRHFEARAAHRLNWSYEDILGNEATFLDDVFRFTLGDAGVGDGGFASDPLEHVKLTPVHTVEKARLRARLAAMRFAGVRRIADATGQANTSAPVGSLGSGP